MRTPNALTVGGALAAGVLLAGCGSSNPPASNGGSASGSGIVQTATSSAGTYLVDSSGHALYVFAADTAGHSNCTASCLQYWPVEPAPATAPSSPAGISATLGVLSRPDGAKQLTIDSLPAYTYSGDTSAGMTAGQGVNASGGLWWLISPDGHALTTSGGSSSSPSSAGHGY